LRSKRAFAERSYGIPPEQVGATRFERGTDSKPMLVMEAKVDRMPLWIELLCDRSNRRRLVPNALSLPPFGFAMQQL
jgi:hypothetical protein